MTAPATPDPLQTALNHHRAGQLDQAERIYQQALAQDGNNIRALHLLGTLMMQQRRMGEAVALLRRAATIAPGSPDIQFALGDALRMGGDAVGAEGAYRQAIALRPLFPQAHNGLGLALVHQQKLESAVTSWQRAIQLKHDYAEAHANLGAALAQLERPSEAAEVLKKAVQLNPNFAPSHNNLANVLDELEQTDDAIAHWERAIALYPEYFDALVNLGRTVQRRGQHQRAMELLDHAVRLRPSDPDARFLRSLALLLQGQLTEGFADYAYRMKCAELKIDPRNFREPEWDGSVHLDKILLLHAEQGFGDTFQFIRYAPLIRERVGQVVLECQAELAELMKTIEGIDVVSVRNQGLPVFDMHIALLDLPRAMGTTLQTIPAFVPYMQVDPQRVAAWRALLAMDPPVKRVGFVWSGNPQHGNDRNRSIALRELEPLTQIEDVALYSLQKGPAAGQLSDSTSNVRLIDHTARLTDFSETAAMLENLDLLITVDTSVAHLAGALGRPVWVLVPFAPDWRWLLDRTDSPWYPTMRLFRQPAIGDWATVIRDVAAALATGIDMKALDYASPRDGLIRPPFNWRAWFRFLGLFAPVVVLEVAAIVANDTIGEVESSFLFVVTLIAAGLTIGVSIFQRRVAAILALLVAMLIVPYQGVLAIKWWRVSRESDRIIAHVEAVKKSTGSYPADLSSYQFHDAGIADSITYTTRDQPGGYYLAYEVGSGNCHSYTPAGGWFYYPD